MEDTKINSVVLVNYNTGQTFEFNGEVHQIVGYYTGVLSDRTTNRMYTITYSRDDEYAGFILAHEWCWYDEHVWMHNGNSLSRSGKTVLDMIHESMKGN